MNSRILLFYFFLFISCFSLLCQWSTSPDTNLQVSTFGQFPEACSDSAGGIYVAWESLNYEHSHLYLQHVTKWGYLQWSPPLDVTEKGPHGGGYRITEDGSGGVILAYAVFTPYDTVGPEIRYEGTLFAQRIDSIGNKLWSTDGVRVSLDSANQHIVDIISYPSGESIVLWVEHTDFYTGYDIASLHIQKISSDGQRLWGDGGVLIHNNIRTSGSKQYVVRDSERGAIVYYLTEALERRFQRIDSLGNLLWTTLKGSSIMISDNNGGAIFATNGSTIYLNHILSDGTLKWGANGLVIEDSGSTSSRVRDLAIRSDSVIVVYWYAAGSINIPHQAKVQMVRPNSSFIFPDSSISPSIISSLGPTGLMESNNNSYIFLFGDERDSSGIQVLAQKLNPVGLPLWDSADVSFNYLLLSDRTLVSDLKSGLIGVGADSPLNGIFAQQINKNGELGKPLTIIDNKTNNILPADFKLFQNYPNPFNSTTIISYYTPFKGKIKITIYNLLGQIIKGYVNYNIHPGNYQIEWNGRTSTGAEISSGVYLYELKSNDYRKVKKLIYLK